MIIMSIFYIGVGEECTLSQLFTVGYSEVVWVHDS